jgi:peptidoglycan/xylan/chitin deacetylase (PgdA/CDA1 family)
VLPPRSWSPHLAALTVTCLVLTALAACAPPQARLTPSSRATSTPIANASTLAPTAGPAPTAGASASPASVHTLAYWLSRVPHFPVAAAGPPMQLAHRAGRASWNSRIPTDQPVAFLTIDDGVTKAPDALALMRAANIRVTLFLTINDISDNRGYFTQLQAAGAVIEAHTISHPDLIKLGYSQQRYELCHGADVLGQWYGRRPVLFRPPYGDENDNTLAAGASCGLGDAFFWKETVTNGTVNYQTSLHRVQPGDIILMHFRTTFDEDFVAALRAIHDAGLTPALLEDYVIPNGGSTGPTPTPTPTPSESPSAGA